MDYFAFCAEKLVGPILWISTLCSTQPMIGPQSVDLTRPGVILSESITVSEKVNLPLVVRFRFDDFNRKFFDRVVGRRCEQDRVPNPEHSMVLPLQVRVLGSDGRVVMDRRQATYCFVAMDNQMRKYRSVGDLELEPGTYRLEVENLEAFPEFSQLHPEIILGAGQYPKVDR